MIFLLADIFDWTVAYQAMSPGSRVIHLDFLFVPGSCHITCRCNVEKPPSWHQSHLGETEVLFPLTGVELDINSPVCGAEAPVYRTDFFNSTVVLDALDYWSCRRFLRGHSSNLVLLR